jgi:hypothetical protein
MLNMNYRKRPMDDFKPVRKEKNGQSEKKIMLAKPYYLTPMYAPESHEIEFFCAELIEWSSKEDSLRLNDFALERKMTPSHFKELCDKWPMLQQAKEIAFQTLASRREKGGLTGKFNSTLIGTSMPIYDKDWKDMYEWKAALAKKEDAKGNTTIIVQVPEIPASKMVPERKTDE